jgi:hypothetical protein
MQNTRNEAKTKWVALLCIEVNEGLLTVSVSQQAKHAAHVK